MRYNSGPQEQGQERWWDDNGFDKKEDAKFLDAHTGEHGLEDPVDEEAEKPSRSDISTRRKMIRKSFKTWPDSFNAILEKACGLNAEDGSPHCSHECSDGNSEVGAVHAED